MPTDTIGPAVRPTPRSLLCAADLEELASLIGELDQSNVEFTGTLRFQGRSIGIGYDAEARCHMLGGI